MFFKKKIDEINKLSKEKLEREHENDDYEEYDPYGHVEVDSTDFTKKDIIPLILSAFIAFSPIFIVLILILVFVYFI